jgi:DNA repair exonuclease SbcCD ATPase subunit
MSVVLKNITLRNFLSIGAVTQAVNFDSKELTLILGENLDLGGDGARNGTGKTTLIQGLSYVLFGSPINQIRKDNLINRTNAKGMMVTLEFSVNGVEYKIERGRRPNVLRFYVNNSLQSKEEKNEAQGENRETQLAIEHAIGMSSDMFKHIVALNTYSEPFLSMKANDQRNVIEQLLGITLLSEKADLIKEKIRLNKDAIQQEEFRNKAVEEANSRVQEQIDALKRRQNLWQKQHDEALSRLVADYDDLSKIDIEAELQAHRDWSVYNEKKKQLDACNALIARQTAWLQKRDADVRVLQTSYDTKSNIDITAELQAHYDLRVYEANKIELATLNKTIAGLEATLTKDKNIVTKLEGEIKTLEENKCYACGQDLHDENHASVLLGKHDLLIIAEGDLAQTQNDLEKNKNLLFVLGTAPTTHYKTEAEAIKHSSELENIQSQISAKLSETDPYAEQIAEQCILEDIGSAPVTHYDTEAEAIEHRTIVANLENSIALKAAESDPYTEQVVDMENKALQEVTFDKINELSKFGDHLKFLIDILTSKDSFVRKKIIDQNLSYLNARLTNYLDKIGLPHNVVFKNDLSVEITELGRELDFDNLSRGERNRLILGLSFAFRDVWENLYFPINTLFIDELIDSGMDSIGVENSMAILKDMSRRRNKSIWLVSHREELAGRVPSVLKVLKENGFTTYSTATDAVE